MCRTSSRIDAHIGASFGIGTVPLPTAPQIAGIFLPVISVHWPYSGCIASPGPTLDIPPFVRMYRATVVLLCEATRT